MQQRREYWLSETALQRATVLEGWLPPSHRDGPGKYFAKLLLHFVRLGKKMCSSVPDKNSEL